MKKQTQAIHVAYERRDAYDSLSVPVYNTLAYEFDNAAIMSDAFTDKIKAPDYSRVENPTVTNLERRMMKRVKQCWEHGTDIDGDHQNRTCNDSKIYARLVTLERLFPFADGEQVIHVKIYTKQDHEHSDHTL